MKYKLHIDIRRERRITINAIIAPVIVIGAFAIISENILHWFVLPLLLCGFILFYDLFKYDLKRMDIYDPATLVGIVAIPFFFLNPLLHVLWDYWMKYVIPPQDWRPWLGRMAFINIAGIIIYRITREFFRKVHIRNKNNYVWIVNEKRLRLNLILAMCISASLQIYIFIRYGGISGYIREFEKGAESFSGMGSLFAFSESFPILLAIFLIISLRTNRIWRNDLFLLTFLFVFIGLQILFGGLRGSRGNILYSAFWIIGIIHLLVRPIPIKKLVVFGVLGLLLMYFFGFYKSFGSQWTNIISREGFKSGLAALEEESGRTIKATILGDFGRSDVQSFLLYRAMEYPGEYKYANGKTYIDDLALLIPQWLWPNRPYGKTLWGTDILRGPGAWSPEPGRYAQNAYGLGGETILNFGPLWVPLMYAVLGFAVAKLTALARRAKYSLISLIFFPLVLQICAWMLVWDFGNIIYFLIQYGLFPFIVVFLSLKGRKIILQNNRKMSINTNTMKFLEAR